MAARVGLPAGRDAAAWCLRPAGWRRGTPSLLAAAAAFELAPHLPAHLLRRTLPRCCKRCRQALWCTPSWSRTMNTLISPVRGGLGIAHCTGGSACVWQGAARGLLPLPLHCGCADCTCRPTACWLVLPAVRCRGHRCPGAHLSAADASAAEAPPCRRWTHMNRRSPPCLVGD